MADSVNSPFPPLPLRPPPHQDASNELVELMSRVYLTYSSKGTVFCGTEMSMLPSVRIQFSGTRTTVLVKIEDGMVGLRIEDRGLRQGMADGGIEDLGRRM